MFKPERVYHTRVTRNAEDNTISVWFEDLPEALVIHLLHSVGFKSRKNGREFYSVLSRDIMRFVDELKAALALGCYPRKVPYTPSYPKGMDSIDSDNFSVVTLHYLNTRGITESESFVIFERTKERREGVAHIIGNHKFGEHLQSVNATYRSKRAFARTLYKEGKYEVQIPEPFGEGCPPRLDYDATDAPSEEMQVVSGAVNHGGDNGGDHDGEMTREKTRERTNDRDNDRYNVENKQTNDRDNDGDLTRADSLASFHDRDRDGDNDGDRDGNASREIHAPDEGGTIEQPYTVVQEKELASIVSVDEVPDSFIDDLREELGSQSSSDPSDPSLIREQFNLLVSDRLPNLDVVQVEELWGVFSDSYGTDPSVELDYSDEEENTTEASHESQISTSSNTEYAPTESNENEEDEHGLIPLTSVEVVRCPNDWEQDKVFESWSELGEYYANLDVPKLEHGYGVIFRVHWKNGDTLEVTLQLFADGANPAVDTGIVGKRAFAQILSRIGELEGRFRDFRTWGKPEKTSELEQLYEWKETHDFGLTIQERLEIERIQKPKVPVERVEVDLGGKAFLSLLTLADWQMFTKASKELENSRGLFGLSDEIKVNIEWKDNTKLEYSIPVVTLPTKWTDENWRNLVKSQLGESTYLDYQCSDKDPLLTVSELATLTSPKRGYHEALVDAYWRSDDNDEQFKIVVGGSVYHQWRLFHALMDVFRVLAEEHRHLLVQEISSRFEHPRDWKSYLGINDAVIALKMDTFDDGYEPPSVVYLRDLAVHLREEQIDSAPFYAFLIDQLIPDEPGLVDLPEPRDSGEGEQRTVQPPESSEVVRSGGKKRYDLNKEIEGIIDRKLKSGEPFTEEDKDLFVHYTGYGGLLSQGANRGVLYEFYTPSEIVGKMWGAALHFGYNGGAYLEPSAGIGVFLRMAPITAKGTAYEISKYSATICQLLYPHVNVVNAAFETIFFEGMKHLRDKPKIGGFDLVVGNPPYGKFTGKYAGMGEKKYTKVKEYDQYFITRSLDLLNPDGLLVFIVSSGFLDGGVAAEPARKRIANQAILLDAYRLPNGVFKTTDVGTDIVVFKKRRHENE